MQLIPKYAMRDGKERVEVLGYEGNDLFTVVDAQDFRFTAMRKQLTFLPGPKISLIHPNEHLTEQLSLF